MEPDPPTILIVEDHHATRRFLADNLAADGYRAARGRTRRRGRLRVIAAGSPDLAIVDLGLPDRDGLELLQRGPRVRRAGGGRLDPQLPVLVLTGRGGELDRIRGFERGADDYLVKPFSYPRAPRPARRAAAPLPGRGRGWAGCASGRWSSTRCRARPGWTGRAVHLTKKEFALRCALATEPTRVFTREELLRRRVGLSVARGRRGRWTRTPPGCAASSASAAGGSWSTCGASATGCSTGGSMVSAAAVGGRLGGGGRSSARWR